MNAQDRPPEADHGHVSGSLACLAVVPIYVRTPEDLDVLLRALVFLRETAPQSDVLVVDDRSPAAELVDLIEIACGELEIELHRRPVNGGFSRAVNVGLRRALDEGRDAVLVNADIEFHELGWLDAMLERTDTTGAPAAVVGARLLYPNGCTPPSPPRHARRWPPRRSRRTCCGTPPRCSCARTRRRLSVHRPERCVPAHGGA